MIPIWAHAYSHRMMTSYQCEKLGRSLSSSIRSAINTVNADYPKIIMFDGVIALVQDIDIDELPYTKKQIGCWLYSSSKNRTDMQVFILVERDMYRYINPPDKGQPIRFLKNDIDIDKTLWFNELFPEMEIGSSSKVASFDDSDLLNEFGVGKKTIDITNMDLTFDTSEGICEINDSLGDFFKSLTVLFQGKEIDIVKPEEWFVEFLQFYLKWRSEIEIQQLEEEFLRDFDALDEKAKEMVMAVREYREILDRKVSSVEVDPSEVEINIDDGESKVGEVLDVDEPEVDKNDSDEAAVENPDEETETDTDNESNTETNTFEQEIKSYLQEQTDVLSCIDTTDVGESREYRMYNGIELIRSDSEGALIRTSKDKNSTYVYQILDNETELTNNGYDELFTEAEAKDIPWVYDEKKFKASFQGCSQYVEYQQANAQYEMEWGPMDSPRDISFRPDNHQFHSLKFAGEKILLGHRPGFGKTINSIILGEKMRNSCCKCEYMAGEGCECDLPYIYILAPDRKLVKHWVEELKNLRFDTNHYIWSTYKHLELSQSKVEYPEMHHVDPKEFEKMKQGDYTGRTKFNKNIRHCMVCDRGYTEQEVVNMMPDMEETIRNTWVVNKTRGVRHILFNGTNDKTVIEHHWRLFEDKIFFSCDKCIGAHFLTGFTPNNDGVNFEKYDDYKEQGLDITDYMARENDQWNAFYEQMKTIASIQADLPVHEIKQKLRDENEQNPQNIKLSYKISKNLPLHMYRAPPNCIVICDEVHLYVKESKSLILQVVWKYLLSCRFSILCSATPVESSGSELNQLYLISEMLRTKRDYWNDEPVEFNVKYSGMFLPPWHLLRSLETGENMYEVASRLKNKFSRFNTVQDIDKAIKDLTATTESKIDPKFKINSTDLMNLYMGVQNTDFALKNKKWVTPKESGIELYEIATNSYDKFMQEALKRLYVKQMKSRGDKEFPDLVSATPSGYIEVPLDLNRALLKDKPPKSELRYLIPQNSILNYSISVEGLNHLVVKESETGNYTAKEVLEIEGYVLCNLFSDGLVTISFQKDAMVNYSAPLISNYSLSTNAKPYSGCKLPERGDREVRERQRQENIEALKGNISGNIEGIKKLSWLYINPTNQSKNNWYDDIPYVPDILGSKVLKIVTTIEDQVRKGKNVMVYHDKVEMLRMVQRGLAMRGHRIANEQIEKARLKPGVEAVDAEAGDYMFDGDLKEHARTQASKRWRMLDEEYIKKQNEAYGYYDEPVVADGIVYSQLKEVFDMYNSLVEKISYPIVYTRYENMFGKADDIEPLTLATTINDFAFYAEYAHYQSDVETTHRQYSKLIEGAKAMKNILKGKITYEKKTEIINAANTYNRMKGMPRDGTRDKFKKLMFELCEVYYKRGLEKAVTKKPEIKRVYNREYYKEVYALAKNFKWKDHKNGLKTRQEVLNYWQTLEDWQEHKELYILKNGVRQTEWVLKDPKNKPDKGEMFEFKETGNTVFKLKNESLRNLLNYTFELNVDINKRNEEIDNDHPLPDLRFQAIDYYLEMNWSGKGKFKGVFKGKQSLTKPYLDYARNKMDEIVQDKPRKKGKDFETYPLPEIGLPDYKPFDFQSITGFIAKNDRVYTDPFFDQKNAKEMMNLDTALKLKGQITFAQYQCPVYLVNSKFKRDIENYEDAFRFCIWSQMYLRYLWVQREYEGKLNQGNVKTIEEYADTIVHLDSNPFNKVAKGKVKINMNGVEMEARQDFLKTMKPRITGMSKYNRMRYAVIEGTVVKQAEQPKYVQAFSEGYIDCLFVSDSGIVGVDYKSCSPSYMICIDPVKSAGKQDQFNGRTVRRRSHKNLPEKMRKVEYVSFVSSKLQVPKEKQRKDEEEVVNYDLKTLSNLVRKTDEPKKTEYMLMHRKMQREQWAQKKLKKALNDLEQLKEDLRKEMDLEAEEEEIQGETEEELENVQEETYNGIYKPNAQDIINTFDSTTIQDIIQKELEVQKLSIDDDKLRQKEMPFNGRYTYEVEEDLSIDLVFEAKEYTRDMIIAEVLPNNPQTASEQTLREMLSRQEYRFSKEDRKDALVTLDYDWDINSFQEDPGINELRRELDKRYGTSCGEITYAEQRKRNQYYVNGPNIVDPCKKSRSTDTQKEPDNKRWDTYFDNYVNLSHVPVYNNYAFVSVEEYLAHVNNGANFDNYYCFACNQVTETLQCKCGFDVKDENGKYYYYHLVDNVSKIQESTASALKQSTRNTKIKDLSIVKRVQRDRLEMVLSLNSIEHQVKQFGDKTYKFTFKNDGNDVSFYKRVNRPDMEEENRDWYEVMTKPDTELFERMSKRYTEQERDRFKGTVVERSAPVKERTKRVVKYDDGIGVGSVVLYNGEEKTVVERNGGTLTLEPGPIEVNVSEVQIKEEEDDETSDYDPEEENELVYDSDISIQSEY